MNPQQKRALNYATVGVIIVGILFLKQYFSLLVVAGIFAYLFNPLYAWFSKRMSSNAAASLTVLASLLAIVVPLCLIALLAVGQLVSVSNGVASVVSTLDLNELGKQAVDIINQALQHIPFVDLSVTEASLIDGANTTLQAVGDALLNYLSGFVTGILGMFTTGIVFIFVLFSLIKHSPHLLNMVRELNPLGEGVTDLYLRKIGAMVRGTVQGQFVIAVVQGFLAATTFALVGYPELFFVLFIIFTTLSIIPLGAGILIIPLGILMALFGNVVGGAVVILEHLLINTNIDNILRPMLVRQEARLDTALMLVSVFSGIAWFGFLGIVIGPTLMIVIVTTVQVYLDVQKGYRPEREKGGQTKNKGTFRQKFSNFGNKLLRRKPNNSSKDTKG